MTGNELIATFDEIVANDLYPVFASTTAQKLDAFNNAKRQIFRMLNYPAVDVPVTITAGVQTYSLNSLATPLYIATLVKLNGGELFKDQWGQVADQITIIPAIVASTVLTLTGYKRGLPVVADYNEYTLHNNGSYDVEEFKQHSKYKVVSSEIRNWNTKDQYFWTQFNIGTKLLNSHYVCPLDSYTLSKTDENGIIYNNFTSGKLVNTSNPILSQCLSSAKGLKLIQYELSGCQVLCSPISLYV